MRPRTAFLTAFLVVNSALAGCANLSGGTTTTATPTETTTTTGTTPDTTGAPQKGDTLLSVSAVDNDTAEAVTESAKANFSELSDTQQGVFLEAHECDCNSNQDVFRFSDTDRIEYVRYEGQWYFLRVSIV